MTIKKCIEIRQILSGSITGQYVSIVLLDRVNRGHSPGSSIHRSRFRGVVQMRYHTPQGDVCEYEQLRPKVRSVGYKEKPRFLTRKSPEDNVIINNIIPLRKR